MPRKVIPKGKPRLICSRCSWRMKWGDAGRFHWSGVCDRCWTPADEAKEADLADKPRKKPNRKAEMLAHRASLPESARESLARLAREANQN